MTDTDTDTDTATGSVPPPQALSGIRVLDFTQMMLGPFATQYLADMGADVIKVERPGEGEWERGLEMGGRLIGATSSAFLAMNRNKRSVALDLKAPGVREALLEIAAQSDVVVENFRPGVMARLGLGYEDVRAVNPRIVYASGSGWGQDTPYARAGRPGQDLLIQAMTGLAANAGRAGQDPVVAGTSMCDAVGALTLTNGILTALLARDRTAVGQHVQVDLYHATLAIMCQEISAMVNQRQDFERSGAGIAQPWSSAPYGIYPARDGAVAIAMGDLAVIDRVLGTDAARLDPWLQRDAVRHVLAAATAERDADELVDALIGVGLWAARARSMRDAVDELREDESPLLVRLRDDLGDEYEFIGCPVTLTGTPWRVERFPPRVGQHTEEVLRELLPEHAVASLLAEPSGATR